MSAQLTSTTVGPEHDQIQMIPDTPGWAENLIFQVHDHLNRVAVWCHWGRMPGSPEVWEGVIALYLNGEELLVSRSFGCSRADDEASSGPLSYRCEQPNQRWAMRFDGMARTTSTAEVAAGPLRDGAVERVRAELTFAGLHPTWSAHGAMDRQSWASAHLEQAGRIEGVLELRDRQIQINAFGFRDHSYGPRDYSGLLGDTWCTAVLPSGRAFLALDVWQLEGPALSKAYLWDGSTLHDARAANVPRLGSADGRPHEFELHLAAANRTERIQVTQQHCMIWTMDEPSALIPGGAPNDPRIYATEGPALMTWDGETGAGWIEKTIRPDRFAAVVSERPVSRF